MMLHRHFDAHEAEEPAKDMHIKEGQDIPVAEEPKKEEPKRRRRKAEN